MASKPTAAFVLLLIGGIIVLGGGGTLLASGLAVNSIASSSGITGVSLFGGAVGTIGIALGALGVICGLLMLVSGIMAYTKTSAIKTWGIIGLVFSIISLGSGGGFILGFILGLVGGILALVYKG